MIRFVYVVGAVFVAAGILGATAPAAEAAYNNCTQSIRVNNVSNGFTRMPADSVNTGNVECRMYRGIKDAGGSCPAGPCNPVRTLQTALVICEGYSIAIDGSFGPATESALKSWQKLKGLTVDGRYGPQTRSYMDWYKYDSIREQYYCYTKGKV